MKSYLITYLSTLLDSSGVPLNKKLIRCGRSVESSLKYIDLKFHMQLNSISLPTQDTSP